MNGDLEGAGLTCIQLFIESKSLEERSKYLEETKTLFVETMKKLENNPKLVLKIPLDELKQYLRKIKIQQEIISSFPTTLGVSSKTLFGGVKHRCEVAETILLDGNYDLGVGVIINFKLPVEQIFPSLVRSMSKNGKSLNDVKELLPRVKVFGLRKINEI